jgi:hypothetical protein
MTNKIHLPPLPDTEWVLHMPEQEYEREWTSCEEGYTSDQMRAYAIKSINYFTGNTE